MTIFSPKVADAGPGVGGEEGLEGTVDVAKEFILLIGVFKPVVLSSLKFVSYNITLYSNTSLTCI